MRKCFHAKGTSSGSPRRLSLEVRAYLIAFARAQGKGRKVDSFFKISQRKSTIGNEIIGGLTTFLAMAYIIAVNPNMLVVAGVPFDAALTATCFGAAIMTIAMGLIANRPIALASGMGINAIVAYTLCLGGAAVDWRVAMAIVFLEGIVILILVACGLRKAVMDAIPVSLRHAIGIGIGLFIAFIGLKGGGIIVANESTILGLGALSAPVAIVSLIAIAAAVVLQVLNVKGGLVISIVLATIIGVPVYADIFGTIPVAQALLGKGAMLGTALSFMMAVTTLSLPSLIMLRRAVKPRLLGVFVAICTVGIILVGYLFNALQPWLGM